MFEFQNRISREHLGLVLNIFDRDHDSWGEVLLAQTGYESMRISLLKYSPSGLPAHRNRVRLRLLTPYAYE
jgi:hypothetical protein